MAAGKTEGAGEFYNLDEIKAIPILEVCSSLGIPVEARRNRYWCKLRPERTASALLHPEDNRFYDFGSHEHGDVINLVMVTTGCDAKEAIRTLASKFGIGQEHRAPGTPREVSDWEYDQIGLYGDLATKNFTFELDRVPIERVAQTSAKYAMPMNELKRQYPKVYERLLVQKAIPYLKTLRETYLLDVWQEHRFMKGIGCEECFFKPDTAARFQDQIEEIRRAERIFNFCAAGTGLRPWRHGLALNYLEDYRAMERGDLKPSMGNLDYNEMRRYSIQQDSPVRYSTVDYSQYVLSSVDQLPHSAFLRSGRVVVGFLERDRETVLAALESGHTAAREPKKGELDEKIKNARGRLEHSGMPGVPERSGR